MHGKHEAMKPFTDAVMQLTREDGNPFFLINRVRRAIRRSNRRELAHQFMREAVADNFSRVLETCRRYVTIE